MGDSTARKPERMRVITVRLPASFHRAFRREAHRQEKSMNQLAVECLCAPLKELVDGAAAELAAVPSDAAQRSPCPAGNG